MNIIVLVKQVPDTTEMKIDKENGTLIRTGVPSIINPDDLAGIEEALSLKDKYGAHVRVISMGPMQAQPMLRKLLGMGVDDVVLVSDRAFAGSDTQATSNVLAASINKYPYDLIIAGRQAIDGDTAQVGPQVAQKLEIPQISYVEEIQECVNNGIRAKKAFEDHSEVYFCKFPVLITTLQSMNIPRYANVVDLVAAFDKEITIVTNEDLNLDSSSVGLSGSPTQVRRTFTRELVGDNEVLTLKPIDAAEAIARRIEPYLE